MPSEVELKEAAALDAKLKEQQHHQGFARSAGMNGRTRTGSLCGGVVSTEIGQDRRMESALF